MGRVDMNMKEAIERNISVCDVRVKRTTDFYGFLQPLWVYKLTFIAISSSNYSSQFGLNH